MQDARLAAGQTRLTTAHQRLNQSLTRAEAAVADLDGLGAIDRPSLNNAMATRDGLRQTVDGTVRRARSELD